MNPKVKLLISLIKQEMDSYTESMDHLTIEVFVGCVIRRSRLAGLITEGEELIIRRELGVE